MKTKRELFLAAAESVAAGLSTRDTVEQASCLVFQDGYVHTFNGETCCRRPLTPVDPGFKEITGAVKADKLVAQLQKWPDDEVEVEQRDGELVFRAGRKSFGLKMEAEVHLPIDTVERPGKWKKLPADFAEAVGVVQHCAGTDETQFALTCVHVSPEHLEACDNFQICRWPMKTGLKRPVLVKKASAKHLTGLGVAEWAETEHWLHFRNPSTGVELSCMRYLEDYVDLSSFLAPGGTPVKLPKGLAEACDKASVFSAENPDADQVQVDLRPGRLRVRGEGSSGWFTQTSKVSYDGAPMSFRAAPAVLGQLAAKHQDAAVSPGRLIITTKDYTYVMNLYVPEPAAEAPAEAEEERPRRRREKAAAAEGE